MFSPPQTSSPGSYIPSSKKYFLSMENRPPAMTGHLGTERPHGVPGLGQRGRLDASPGLRAVTGREGEKAEECSPGPAWGETIPGLCPEYLCLSRSGKHRATLATKEQHLASKEPSLLNYYQRNGLVCKALAFAFFYLIISVSLILFFSMTSCGICLHPKFIGQVKIPRWKLSTVM